MDKIFDLIKREPVLAANIVQSILTLAVSFGLQFTADQIGAILLVTNTITGFIARAYVVPGHIADERVEVALRTPVPPHTEDGIMDLLKPDDKKE